MGNKKIINLAIVSSCFNEEDNIKEFYNRCINAINEIKNKYKKIYKIYFEIIISDNCSKDSTLEILKLISKEDKRLTILQNFDNFGPEISLFNSLMQSVNADIVFTLCSDLQDPPEILISMIEFLLEGDIYYDGVHAIKSSAKESLFLIFLRRWFYLLLSGFSRLNRVPNGFHGTGLYRKDVIENAITYWQNTGLTRRQCLVNASAAPNNFFYNQNVRKNGKSSYTFANYIKTAFEMLIRSDATASSLAFTLVQGSIFLAFSLGSFILINTISGGSLYSRGTPTLMGIVILSFLFQMLMMGIMSRQLEEIRFSGIRKRLNFKIIKNEDNKEDK